VSTIELDAVGHCGVEQRFAAMGTRAHVIVEGPDAQHLIESAIDHIDELEARWSRFRPDSEISQLNAANGSPLLVHSSTVELIDRAIQGWYLTQGRFDPTLLPQLIELGYDRSFAQLGGSPPETPPPMSRAPSIGCADIVVDLQRSIVRLPPGLAFDPGGIGKGFAADLVSHRLIEHGATRALVNLGGDMRIRSTDPLAEPWAIEVSEPTCPLATPTVVQFVDGGLATSTTQKRRWASPEGDRHHLIDPASGQPRTDGPVLTSAIASEAWWAEVVATASTDLGSPPLDSAATRRVFADGTVEHTGGFERYEG
jgi:thiamine biosynthesis lipoprotein